MTGMDHSDREDYLAGLGPGIWLSCHWVSANDAGWDRTGLLSAEIIIINYILFVISVIIDGQYWLILCTHQPPTSILLVLLVVPGVSSPPGVIVVVTVLPAIKHTLTLSSTNLLPSPAEVVHTVDERHPVPGLVEVPCVWEVSPVAPGGQPEAVGLGGRHVTAVGRPGLSVETEIARRGRRWVKVCEVTLYTWCRVRSVWREAGSSVPEDPGLQWSPGLLQQSGAGPPEHHLNTFTSPLSSLTSVQSEQ